MKHNGLTALRVRRLTKPGRHADGNGLYLAISENGAKSWVFMWKRNGVRKARGLGSAGTVSLAEAENLPPMLASLSARAATCRAPRLSGPVCQPLASALTPISPAMRSVGAMSSIAIRFDWR